MDVVNNNDDDTRQYKCQKSTLLIGGVCFLVTLATFIQITPSNDMMINSIVNNNNNNNNDNEMYTPLPTNNDNAPRVIVNMTQPVINRQMFERLSTLRQKTEAQLKRAPTLNESRVAICISGGYRTFDRVKENIWKHFVHSLKPMMASVDVFGVINRVKCLPKCRTPDVKIPPGSRSAVSEEHIRKTFTGMGNVVDLEVYLAYQDEFVNTTTDSDYFLFDIPSKCDTEGSMMYWQMEKCWKLVRRHEQKKNVRYDWIIRARPDIVWSDSFNLPKWVVWRDPDPMVGYMVHKYHEGSPEVAPFDFMGVFPRRLAPHYFTTFRRYLQECVGLLGRSKAYLKQKVCSPPNDKTNTWAEFKKNCVDVSVPGEACHQLSCNRHPEFDGIENVATMNVMRAGGRIVGHWPLHGHASPEWRKVM